jgi:hypothetical protein
MLDLVKNIVEVARAVLQLATGVSAVTRDRKDRLADLLANISKTLAQASSELKTGATPHGSCAKLLEYSEQLARALNGFVPQQKAEELGDTLRSSYAVESLAISLQNSPDKPANLSALDEAAGKFEAAAELLRAS